VDPSRSRTVGLVNGFVESLRARVGEVAVRYIHLNRMTVAPCRGCLSCTRTGGCPIEDDVPDIRRAMQRADLLILASPVHFNHVSSIFHGLVERFLLDQHTFSCIGVPFVTAVTTNGSGEEVVDKYLTRMGLLLGGLRIGSLLGVGTAPFGSKKNDRVLEEAAALLAGRKRPRSSLTNRLYFSFMKRTIRENPECFPFENRWWNEKGWFDRSFSAALEGRRIEGFPS
jgi:multimeric flavodoxin WrbA